MAPGRLFARHVVLIVLFGLLVLIPGTLPSVRPLSAHEVLAAQPAKEMLRDGHWIVQTYAGVPRYEKPPTIGWLIAASMTIFQSSSEWVLRLPSVISGIVAALLVAALAARWMGSTVGTLAGLIQLSSYWVLKQATLSEADMPLAAAVTAAFTLFALGNVEHPQGRIDRPWVRRAFMLATGVAFLLKGPIALLFIFSGIALYIALRRPWGILHRFCSICTPRFIRHWPRWSLRFFLAYCRLYVIQRRLPWTLRFFTDPIGMAILVILLIAWPAAVLLTDPSAWTIWHQELTGYATDETFGRSGFWLYFHDIPLVLLPWFGLLVVAAVETIRHRLYRLPLTVFLLCWFIAGFIVLQCAAYKSVHYTFPLLPPASIAMAAGMIWWLRRQSIRPIMPPFTAAVVIALASICSVIAIRIFAAFLPPATVPAILICAAGFVIAVLLERARRIRLQVIVVFATVALGIVIADLCILPKMPGTWTRKDFAQTTNQHIPAGQTLYLVDFVTDETVWYLNMPLQRFDTLRKFAEFELPPDGVYALVRERTLEKLAPRYHVEVLERAKEAKRSDTKHSDSRVPVLVRLQRVPTSQPAALPLEMN